MKGTIQIMLAKNQLGHQVMSVEIDVDNIDKNGAFTILDHLMDALGITPAEAREFALRNISGKFKHKTIANSRMEIDSAECRAYRRMMEGMLGEHQ